MNFKEMLIWVFVLVLCGGVLLSPVACTMHREALIAEAIKSGADPLLAMCAIDTHSTSRAECAAAAASR